MKALEKALYTGMGLLTASVLSFNAACAPSAQPTPTPEPRPPPTLAIQLPTPTPTVMPTLMPTYTPVPRPSPTPLPTVLLFPTPTVTSVPTPTPVPTATPTPLPTPTPTPPPIIKIEIVDTTFSEGSRATIRFRNTGNVPLKFVDGDARALSAYSARDGDITIERTSGYGHIKLIGNKTKILPGETATLIDLNSQPAGFPPTATYVITLPSGEGTKAVVSIPNLLENIRSNTINEDIIKSTIVRRDMGEGDFNDSLYNYVFGLKNSALIFSSYIAIVSERDAKVTVAVATYAGVRRSDLIRGSGKLINLVRELAGEHIQRGDITSLHSFQVSPSGREEAVVALEYTIPLRLDSPEAMLWRFDNRDLKKIPKIFPKTIPLRVGIRVYPTTDLAALAGGLAYPVANVYPIRRFTELTKYEAGGYFDATERLDSEEIEKLYSMVIEGASPDSLRNLFQKFVGMVSLANILYDPASFYLDLTWRSNR